MILKVNRLATFICTIACGYFLVSTFECRCDCMVVILTNYLSSQQQFCLKGICSEFSEDVVRSALSLFQWEMLSDANHVHFSSDQIITYICVCMYVYIYVYIFFFIYIFSQNVAINPITNWSMNHYKSCRQTMANLFLKQQQTKITHT